MVFQNGALCVNTLRPVHELLLHVFGAETSMEKRFAHAKWKKGISGAPLLDGAAVSFDCRVTNTYEIGTHLGLLCEVLRIERHQMASALISFDRGYHRICGVSRMKTDDRILNTSNEDCDNRRWTELDLKRLSELAIEKVSKVEIGSILGRTSYAVEEKARKHGIKLTRATRSSYLKSDGEAEAGKVAARR